MLLLRRSKKVEQVRYSPRTGMGGQKVHEPPPPPNQTIYAEFEPGYELKAIWEPFWIEGKIFVSRVEENLATASYTLIANKIEPFR